MANDVLLLVGEEHSEETLPIESLGSAVETAKLRRFGLLGLPDETALGCEASSPIELASENLLSAAASTFIETRLMPSFIDCRCFRRGLSGSTSSEICRLIGALSTFSCTSCS